ncbi:hypothetical protein [Yersinia hibernica]|uniref:Uncharacterized protein n=1 Tax=Yersinia enterocolitica LC20 TaxID=1443113 RepID=A0A7U4GI95_YEREN|nr:hypothetical protein [Yersinia hibernica]AHM75930.1 hypothetical protein LC20_04677 [Yersinia hibernica]OVZ93273.1 hypothetical protein CBW54_02830 [Yersinia kristensenii]
MLQLKGNVGIFYYLVKVGLIWYIAGLSHNPCDFNPIEMMSTKPKNNLLAPIIDDTDPFKIYANYSIDMVDCC